MIRCLALLFLAAKLAAAISYPAATVSGSVAIQASLRFAGSSSVTLGAPAALTSVCAAGHEFTVLVRTARLAAGSSGVIIGQGDNATTAWSISSTGGSRVTATVGGTSTTTGAGSIQNPTWNSIALVNRNTGSGYAFRIVLDSAAGTAEVADGAQTSTRDLLIGARRGASNADTAAPYSGFVGSVQVWNYALTDDQAHYAMGFTQPDEVLANESTGLVACWPCNETSGTVLHECQAGLAGTCSAGDVFSLLQWPKHPLVLVGDSLANGSGGTHPPSDQTWTGGSGMRHMRSTMAYGWSGQNCAFILAKLQLASYAPFLSWTQVYIVGAHDLGTNSAVTSLISTATLALPHTRWLVIGQRPYGVGTAGSGDPTAAGTGDWGVTARTQTDSMNALERSLYGARFVDAQANAVAQANLPTEANDVFQQRTPVSLCSDSVHMIDPGYIAQSIAVDTALNLFSW